MASLRSALRPRLVARAANNFTRSSICIRPISASSRLYQEAVAPAPLKVRTEGPLYSHDPKAVVYSRRVTIPIDNSPVEFDSIFLRDSCVCPACVDPSSSQKNFQTSDIPVDIQGAFWGTTTCSTHGVESAVLRWDSDAPGYGSAHETTIPIQALRKAIKGDDRTHISHFQLANRKFWDNETMTRENVFIDFADYKSSDQALYDGLKQIESHGLLFLKNVPDCSETNSAASVTEIVNRIGTLRSTFYGYTWDVRSVPKAINVAYTHQYLGLHADLCYMDLTPQYQFLHSLRARAPGGASMFSDAFATAEALRSQHPGLFKSLCTFPVTFHYYNAGQSYRQVRTTIELADQSDLSSPIQVVNWSPPFQGPLAKDIGNKDGGEALRTFVRASHAFETLLSAPGSVFELRLNEGECVIFDNRRVLHARREFDITKGERWLKGAYLDRDVFASRLARLEEEYGE
jgi:gamma-butyrobetaine dioxygenase